MQSGAQSKSSVRASPALAVGGFFSVIGHLRSSWRSRSAGIYLRWPWCHLVSCSGFLVFFFLRRKHPCMCAAAFCGTWPATVAVMSFWVFFYPPLQPRACVILKVLVQEQIFSCWFALNVHYTKNCSWLLRSSNGAQRERGRGGSRRPKDDPGVFLQFSSSV